MNREIETAVMAAVGKMTETMSRQEEFCLKEGKKLPNRGEIIQMLKELRSLLFPGYFGKEDLGGIVPDFFLGNGMTEVYQKASGADSGAISYQASGVADEKGIRDRVESICAGFFKELPVVQQMLLKDVEAAYEGDPAAKSREEIIFSYPGLFAIFVYRIAHVLYMENIPFIPRIMTEYAHSKTGIDIHAGAVIGEYFFIDHGTGVVIGETALIGNHVKIYQGVTLGALSTKGGQRLSGIKRHPTVEDNVTIYAGSTILGGSTVLGKNSIIGGNAFVTQSVPEDAKVLGK